MEALQFAKYELKRYMAEMGVSAEIALASPVYELYGLKGLVMEDEAVEINKPYHQGTVAYHRAPGGHDLDAEDWAKYLDFADKYWGPTGRWKPYFYP